MPVSKRISLSILGKRVYLKMSKNYQLKLIYVPSIIALVLGIYAIHTWSSLGHKQLDLEEFEMRAHIISEVCQKEGNWSGQFENGTLKCNKQESEVNQVGDIDIKSLQEEIHRQKDQQ